MNTTVHLLPKQVAERWHMSVNSLANWRTKGQGPRFVKCGKRVLYPITEIEAFELANLHTATSVRPV